jgi:hypothetical protein
MIILSEENDIRFNSGTWGVQARFSDLTFKHFQGTLFSGQKFISTDVALRFGVNGSWRAVEPNYASDHAFKQQDSTRSNLDIYLNFVKYTGTSRLKFFWGAGPYLGSAYNYDRIRKSKGVTWEVAARWSEQTINIGMSGLVGVEYLLNSHLSILAEYMTLFYYQHGRHLNKVIGNFTETRWHITPQPVKFGVAVYF